jgi:hypothetical protein
MDGISPEVQGTVLHALDLLSVVNGVAKFGLTPLSLSDFNRYEFELINYFQTQLSLTRPKKS